MNKSSTRLIVLAMDSALASLALVGGKGRALAKLTTAGLPVPDGFLVSTRAYKEFAEVNRLQASVVDLVAQSSQRHFDRKMAVAQIRSLFEAATIPVEIVASIKQAYSALGTDEPAVAVRSSATAEDLPEMSFAGQQESYLNVCGVAAVLDAIRKCWASLWTARAIGYRQRMDIDHGTVAMGVVVQRMVQADISGILFTANPSNGERSELVINASFGLGEAIVGGLVTPDTCVLDRVRLEPKRTVIGAKNEMIVLNATHGTMKRPVKPEKRDAFCLPEQTLRELGALSLETERLFDGIPQDIEWAVADEKCWLLQSRPITKLPPPPLKNVIWEPPTKGTKLIRRQVVENMPEPLSPLFEDLYLQEGLERSIDKLVVDFRIPCKIEDFMERPMFVTVNGYAYSRATYRVTWRLIWIVPRILLWYVTSLRRLFKNVIPNWRDRGLPTYLKTIESWKQVDPKSASDQQLLLGVRELTVADAIYWFDVAIVIAAAKVTDGMLNRFLRSWLVRGKLTSGTFLSGFASKTMEAQEALEAVAERIQKNDALRELVRTTSARELLHALKQEYGESDVVEAIDRYLQQYGHQIYNLDFVQPTQQEDPLPVLLSLKSLVVDQKYDTRVRQSKMATDRESRIQETRQALGPIRRLLFGKLLGWAQFYGLYREEALFYIGAAWPTLRSLALELGDRLVQVGTLSSPDDVFFLTSSELSAACIKRTDRSDLAVGSQVVQRRELREARKQLHAPGMVPEGSRFNIGPFDFSAFETQRRNTEGANTLSGFAVSPGVVTGMASVILSPDDFEKMRPDSILVCPATTPAWTPLFSQAIGLATDIGGILAHGSIVAREYGIPAVMGTGNGTRRIASGQRITVDGDSGTVTLE